MSRSHNLAWLAGFFDGDGYITIERGQVKSKHTDNVYLRHQLKIGVNHVHPSPIDEVVRLVGGNVRYDAKVKGNRKPRYSWTCPPKLAKEVLIQMLPYMINKKNVAKLGVEFQQFMEDNAKARLTDQVLEKRNWYADEIRRINSES